MSAALACPPERTARVHERGRPAPRDAVADAAEAYAALARLLTVALTDTGQGRRCANFVLAWWNAGRDGGFDLTDLFNVDRAIAADMKTVFAYLAQAGFCFYPNEYEAEIVEILALHRGRAAPKGRAS